MSASNPLTAIAIYRVRPDKLDDFFAILRKHYPVLKGLGLVTDERPIVYSGKEQEGGPIVVEIFTWKDADAPNTAHQLPEVMAVWEPMGEYCEDRGGKPKFEFPHVERLDFELADA